MDSVFKNMDFPVKHWAAYPRHYPAHFRLATACAVSAKSDWVRMSFDTCNFSLILRGRGEYRHAGRLWPVQAPCVITQWPGKYVEYGPPPGETWDELYLIYDASLFESFQNSRLIDLSRPVWPIANIAAVRAQMDELATLALTRHPEEACDRIDRVCERLILETWTPASDPFVESDTVSMVQAVAREIRHNLAANTDFDLLAVQQGISPATFRRHWARCFPQPPARYRLELRIREACRLLTETTRPIHEIARTVGFRDEMYFSRRFHQEMKLAPRSYRRMYQIHRDRYTGQA